MAEDIRYEEHVNALDLSKPTESVAAPVFIDLTDSDDYQKASVSSDNLSSIFSETFEASTSLRSTSSESLDESVSIVYEHITPQPELQVVDLAGDIVDQLLKEGSGQYPGKISRKVRIGAKSMNVSVSICTQSKQEQSNSSSSADSPEIARELASQATSKIQCGICLDAADEIAASERKLLATVCGHIFCADCYAESLKSSRLCPKCRKRLTKKQVHPLYV